MATVRALSLALQLAFCICFAACACEAAARMPKNRYISYAGRVTGGGNGHSHSWITCSAFTGKCPNSRRAPPTEAGATTATAGSMGVYMTSHAASPSDGRPAPTKAGAKTGAAGSKGRYISSGPAAMSAEKPCGRLGCPSRP